MKKRKLVYVGAVAVGLSLSACSDSFLDMNNYGAYDDFNSETKVTWYLAGLYSNYYNTYNSPVQELVGAWGSTDWTYMTDEEWGIHTGTKIDPNSSYGTIDDIKSWEVSSGKYEDPMLSGYFGDRLGSSVKNNAYTRIRNCNILLRDIDNATVSKETRQRAKGQALFLRAVQLFDLVRIYGPVPIVTEVINAEATDNGLPRASVTQCVSQIVKDLNEAAGYLPASWNGNDAGRPTRLTALAYKSRVLLFYASPIFNKHWDDPADTRWKKALAAAQNALAEAGDGGVASATEWGSVLGNDDNLVNANARKEAIFVKLLTTDFSADGAETNRWESRVRLTSQQGGGGKAVPMELIDEFPMADGTRPKAKDRIANGNLRFVENRDPRFYQTFAFSGMKWGYAENKEHVAWNYRWRTQDANTNSFAYSDGNQVASPAFVRKMSNIQTPSDGSYEASGIDLYEYRYAELVLNLAECYAATGDLQKCKETIAILRRRVGIPEGSSYYGLDETVKDRHSALESCLYERRIELAYEGKRFWDIWRWLLYDGGQGSELKLSDVNTCQALGVEPLNGCERTSKYLDLKAGSYAYGDADALAEERKGIYADPDSPDFQMQLSRLADFYETHFEFGAPTSPADKDANNKAAHIHWQANYYINGLSKTVLDNNPWLGQTKGWTDQNTRPGTIDWQDEETLDVD